MYTILYTKYVPAADKRWEVTLKISEEIAETLRDEIIAGIYKPKQRLIEEELSEKFFVSRTPIREALKQLEAAGLVTIEPYKGAFISDVDLEEIRNIYELRCVLEAFVTAQSVEHINPETVAQLRGCLERMNMCIDTSDTVGFAAENTSFHAILFERCPNKVAVQFVQKLLDRTAAFRALSWRTVSGMKKSMEGHQRIFEALVAGDAEAAQKHAAQHIRLYMKEELIPLTQKKGRGSEK